ncbi:SVM family protein [Italian clover phyllody phytoplasma]|uniref:SVM family protein n=1 Tax=Italian clover phyllody phytoplasma TaxID=1196420 RepID=UPI0002D6548C|nr:SVM family protein [Italian clover phyllody phytoplasma]
MFKIKYNLLFSNIFVFIGLSLFLITNNNSIMAAPKKNHGKDIISSKEEAKKDVKNFYELYNTLENYSEEDRNKIIQMLSNPEITKILEDKAKEERTERNKNLEKGSSSKKSDDDQSKK